MSDFSRRESVIDAIHNHLQDKDISYRYDGERGVFHFFLSIGGKAQTLIYVIVPHDHGMTVYARYPMGMDAEDEEGKLRLMQFITRANHGLRNGNFEMDLDNGSISYKIHNSCRGAEPSSEMVEEAILTAAAMYRKYEEGLLAVLFLHAGAGEAVARCEGGVQLHPWLEKLRTLLEEKRAAEQTENETM